MIEILILRFEAPLMSCGAPIVDHHGVIQDFPARSALTGLMANALGYRHKDADKTSQLQERLRYACRCDVPGIRLVDYQTVDLGQDFLIDSRVAWTTRGQIDARGSGAATKGTHIRERHFWADRVLTLALSMAEMDDGPDLGQIETALRMPMRPLFLGRKSCIPASEILIGHTRAVSLRAALESQPRHPRGEGIRPLIAWWPAEDEAPADSRTIAVCDERDWVNQIHVGRRLVRQGWVEPPPRAPQPETADVH